MGSGGIPTATKPLPETPNTPDHRKNISKAPVPTPGSLTYLANPPKPGTSGTFGTLGTSFLVCQRLLKDTPVGEKIHWNKKRNLLHTKKKAKVVSPTAMWKPPYHSYMCHQKNTTSSKSSSSSVKSWKWDSGVTWVERSPQSVLWGSSQLTQLT